MVEDYTKCERQVAKPFTIHINLYLVLLTLAVSMSNAQKSAYTSIVDCTYVGSVLKDLVAVVQENSTNQIADVLVEVSFSGT